MSTLSPTRFRWVILFVVFILTTNNYLDRIMLNTLSTVIMDNLHFGEKEYGWIMGAFNLAYAIAFPLMGMLVDWKGTRAGYAFSVAIWSIAAGMHALARGWLDLGIYRGLLGLGESGNFPSAIKAVSQWFPNRERALANGLFNSGTNIAAVVGPPLFIWMNAVFGWRSCFLITASTGTICFILWLAVFRLPREHKRVNEAELAIIESDPPEIVAEKLTWNDVLHLRPTYGFAVAKLFSDPVWWFYMQWLVPFFNRERHLDLKQIAWALPVIYMAASVGSVAGGWLSGKLIDMGWRATRARLGAMAICAMCMPIAATAVRAESLWAMVALVGLATAAHQAWSANLFATVGDSFPKNAVASVTGLGGFTGGIGGVIFASLVPGYVVPVLGYFPVFVMMGVLHPIALGFAYWFFVHKPKAAAQA